MTPRPRHYYIYISMYKRCAFHTLTIGIFIDSMVDQPFYLEAPISMISNDLGTV